MNEASLQKLTNTYRRQEAISQQWMGLINLHNAAITLNDKVQEAELRDKLHATLDIMLDINLELKQIICDSE